MKDLPEISIVVPVYNEAENIHSFISRLETTLLKLRCTYEILFCLDPSPDNTEEILQQEINRNPAIKLIIFSRRFGQPAATMAGILLAQGNACVVIDADLQDPPELIHDLYLKLQEGYEVVVAKRRTRTGETWLKNLISRIGYKVIALLSEVEIPRDTGDFRIMTRRVIEELRRLNENHGFLRGLVAYVGFKQIAVEYDRQERFKGRGHYNRYIGSLRIGLNGLVSFSRRPLQAMSLLGAFIAGLSFLLGLWYVLQKWLGIPLTPGLSTTVLVVTFFSGVQLLSLGLIGEYIGRIYDEVKRRPLFIIDRIIERKETFHAIHQVPMAKDIPTSHP